MSLIEKYLYERNRKNSGAEGSRDLKTGSSAASGLGTEAQTRREARESYANVLEKVRQNIISNHSSELAEVLYSDKAAERLKNLIIKYINNDRLSVADMPINQLSEKIYNDMAGFGLLTKYLQDPETEEINVNGYDKISVVYGDRKIFLDEKFNSVMECISIVKKMCSLGGVTLDGSNPIGDSFVSKGVRISAAIYPCVDEDVGTICSIRKQKPSFITRENLIAFETATEDELDFLIMCINNGISVAIAGATGSGKTALINYLLSTIVNDERVVTIEDTREIQLLIPDVINLITKDAPNPVSMLDLLKLTLRLHPAKIVPAEMRGAEALTVQEAGRTGHTIVSTLHAKNAVEAYDRILTMCLQAETSLSEDRMLKMIVQAFPIMVFSRQLKDRCRKIIEIFEATGVEDGKVTGNFIFKFVPKGSDKDGEGNVVKIKGSHMRMKDISDELRDDLLLDGVDEELVYRYAGRENESREDEGRDGEKSNDTGRVDGMKTEVISYE